jgi:hypothetical protein
VFRAEPSKNAVKKDLKSMFNNAKTSQGETQTAISSMKVES